MLTHSGGSVDDNPAGARLQFVDLDNSPVQSLEISPLNFQAPVIPPAGAQILVVARQTNGTEGLFLLSQEGEPMVKLGDVEGRVAFDYSPSGRYLAMVIGPELQGVHVGRLVIMDLVDPQNPKRLPSIAEDVAAFWWSPISDELIYLKPGLVPDNLTQPIRNNVQGDVNVRLEVHLYSLADETHDLLTRFEPTQEFFRILPYYDQYQRSATLWSPDGSHIVYPALLQGEQGGIFVLVANPGSTPLQIGEGILAFWSWR
jgi:hypothetical protein